MREAVTMTSRGLAPFRDICIMFMERALFTSIDTRAERWARAERGEKGWRDEKATERNIHNRC